MLNERLVLNRTQMRLDQGRRLGISALLSSFTFDKTYFFENHKQKRNWGKTVRTGVYKHTCNRDTVTNRIDAEDFGLTPVARNDEM